MQSFVLVAAALLSAPHPISSNGAPSLQEWGQAYSGFRCSYTRTMHVGESAPTALQGYGVALHSKQLAAAVGSNSHMLSLARCQRYCEQIAAGGAGGERECAGVAFFPLDNDAGSAGFHHGTCQICPDGEPGYDSYKECSTPDAERATDAAPAKCAVQKGEAWRGWTVYVRCANDTASKADPVCGGGRGNETAFEKRAVTTEFFWLDLVAWVLGAIFLIYVVIRITLNDKNDDEEDDVPSSPTPQPLREETTGQARITRFMSRWKRSAGEDEEETDAHP